MIQVKTEGQAPLPAHRQPTGTSSRSSARRGGTHLMLFKAKRASRVGTVRSFDFMVNEVETLRTRLAEAGVETTEPAADDVSGHRWFQARDPDGHLLNIYSDRTQGRAV